MDIIRGVLRRLRRNGASARPVHALATDAGDLPPSPFGEGFPPCPTERIEKLDACPACGGGESTPVCNFNKLIFFPHPPDAASYRYSYALCHACGVVSARLRPAGPRYAWMVEHFEETLGRMDFGEKRAPNLILSSEPLTPETRSRLQTLAAKGVFVSDHAGLTRKEYLPGLLSDRLSNSVHVELLGSLLPLESPRVLEIRSRLGSISAALQRLYGAAPHAMALFPNQQFLIEQVYNLPASVGIDYDRFDVPFDGTFDLIVANHMLTHAVRPREMLAALHQRLEPGGHLYLFNEPDEREFTAEGKSIFNTLNAFHMQAFDGPSLVRMLEANGFRVQFSTLYNGTEICLAQKGEQGTAWSPIDQQSRQRRVDAYQKAERIASLLLPPHARTRIDGSWEALLQRGIDEGIVEINRKGSVKLRRPETA